MVNLNKTVSVISRVVRGPGKFSWTILDQAMVSGSNFAFGVVLTRHLGLEGFGRFSLAWMAVIFACTILDAFTVLPMLSIGPRQAQDERASYYGSVVLQGLACSWLASLVIFVLMSLGPVDAFGPSFRALALVVAGATFTFLLQNLFRFYFFANGRLAHAVLCDAVSYPGQLIALLILIRCVEVDLAVALAIAGTTSGLAALIGLLRSGELCWSGRVFVTTLERHWHFGKWLAGSALIRWSAYDLFLIGAGEALGASAVGLMKSVQNITNMFQSLYAGIDGIATPTAARRYHEGGRPALIAYGTRLTASVAAITGAMLLVIVVAPGFWLNLFYGRRYAEFGPILRWFAAIQFAMTFLYLGSTFLRTLEATRIQFFSYAAATVVNLLSMSFFLERWGMGGAVMGTALGRLVMLAVTAAGLWLALKPSSVARLRFPRVIRPGVGPRLAEIDEICPNV